MADGAEVNVFGFSVVTSVALNRLSNLKPNFKGLLHCCQILLDRFQHYPKWWKNLRWRNSFFTTGQVNLVAK
jgi:hypothetical protein